MNFDYDFYKDFDYNKYPYHSTRRVIFGKNGMVATSSPYATSAGAKILLDGGNAIDAALAVSMTLPVVEPTGNGLGSDMFAIIFYNGKLYGINASGRSPKNISIDALKKKGYDSMPSCGINVINTPGLIGGFMKLHKDFSTMSLDKVFEPAISYAEEGFAVTPQIAKLWKENCEKYKRLNRDEFSEFFKTFTVDGNAPKAGEIFRAKDMANTLIEIADTSGKSFYNGRLAEKISDEVERLDGFLDFNDLKSFNPSYVNPISTNYRGIDIWEIPPNGHGISVLMALNILSEMELKDRRDPNTIHNIIEAIKLSLTDAKAYVADPKDMKIKIEELLSDNYARKRRGEIKDNAIIPEEYAIKSSDTVYFATADKYGNMVSMIQSNYSGFGSGIVVPSTGIALNNRVENFYFKAGLANSLEGGKLPYHTIIPGFMTRDEEALGAFGIMGAFMQPQAHVEVLTNMIDFNLNPQAALDAPRIMWTGDKKIDVECDFYSEIIEGLKSHGHDVNVVSDFKNMGRGQIILKKDDVYIGGTEKRTDSNIFAY
ncbi:MAG: gamma-glutamyltransferase family protein [Peptoniphilus rhinitidis]|uniref:gamma-glutamyltransferase family protein n=1 Tax=Peptoniphilus rhinitidis TaxID=1175452 RepID=UPI0028FF6C1C|nr:gamma-glutamyltransferase family protein [Peptoniphilus rhinitidis]MDU2109139.1 gamma-glutamyltransferase family protein [Peptoniphilus lacydonensis]MDU3750469.1 gamma-glutamyltransferase family protein [Peptoniphilus rhinitidis]